MRSHDNRDISPAIHHLGGFLARNRCRMYLAVPLALASDLAGAVPAVSAPSDLVEVRHSPSYDVDSSSAHHSLFGRPENSLQHSVRPAQEMSDGDDASSVSSSS